MFAWKAQRPPPRSLIIVAYDPRVRPPRRGKWPETLIHSGIMPDIGKMIQAHGGGDIGGPLLVDPDATTFIFPEYGRGGRAGSKIVKLMYRDIVAADPRRGLKPQVMPFAGKDPQDLVGRKRGWVIGVGEDPRTTISVKPVEAICGRDPDQTFFVLGDIGDQVAG